MIKTIAKFLDTLIRNLLIALVAVGLFVGSLAVYALFSLHQDLQDCERDPNNICTITTNTSNL